MSKNPSDKPLKLAIDHFLNSSGMSTVFDELEIEQTYKELMGRMIVSKTETIWFSKGVLHLRLTSAALKQELSMNKSKIAELINEKLGKELVREVVIK